MKIVGCHVTQTVNIGDLACCPLDYFPELDQGHRVDVRELTITNDEPMALIAGGGGLLHPSLIEPLARAASQRHPNVLIVAWGIGTNSHEAKEALHPKFLDNFDLVGLRDWQTPWRYVPCPSCMNPWFDRQEVAQPQHEVVVYSHFQVPIPMVQPVPAMDNSGKAEDISKALEFLSSGKCVVTNSYHGAYWAQLLNRKVIVWQPFSSRFYHFFSNPHFCLESDWRPHVPLAKARTENFLSDCRKRNVSFAAEVMELLAK